MDVPRAEVANSAWAHVRREAPVHVIMVVVMVGTMVAHSSIATLVGAAALVAVSVVCAALSRTRDYLREHVVDLWAMALVLLVFLPRADAAGASHGHALAVPALGAFAAVTIAWGASRAGLAARRSPDARPGAAASAALTAAQLGVMAALCA